METKQSVAKTKINMEIESESPLLSQMDSDGKFSAVTAESKRRRGKIKF
jgi:hypothetical protein